VSSNPDQPGPAADDVAALREEVARLRDRVDALEEQVGAGTSSLPPAAKDYRDARVLKALDAGDVVPLQRLRTLYQERSDVRDADTLRDRVESLVSSDAFENIGMQRWRYHGPGGTHEQ
jgi:hypothetical protein